MEDPEEKEIILPDRADFTDPEFRFLSGSKLPLLSGEYIIPSPVYMETLIKALGKAYSGLVIGYKLDYMKASLQLNNYNFTYLDLSVPADETENTDLQQKAPYDLLIFQNTDPGLAKEYENLLAASYTLIMPLANENGNQTVVMIKEENGIPEIQILGSFSLLRTYP